MFEDSEAGMEAGLAAGMHTVVIPDPNFTRQEVQERFAAASETLASLADWDPATVGLPPL